MVEKSEVSHSSVPGPEMFLCRANDHEMNWYISVYNKDCKKKQRRQKTSGVDKQMAVKSSTPTNG